MADKIVETPMAFPFQVNHPKYGMILVRDETDLENCIKNGCSVKGAEKINAGLLKERILKAETDLQALYEQLDKLESKGEAEKE